MPTYEITAPDGKTYEVTAPDGASEQEVLAYAQQNYKPAAAPKPQQAAPAAAQAAPPDAIARYEAAQQAAYAGTGTDRYGRTAPPVSQSLDSLTGASVADLQADNAARQATADPAASQAANLSNRQAAFSDANPLLQAAAGVGSRIPSAAMGIGQMLGITDQQDAARQRERMAFMDESGAASAGKFGADVAATLIPASKIAALPSLAGRVAGNAAVGAGLGAVAPTVEGESRGLNALISGVAGAGGELASKGLGMAAKRALASDPVRAVYEAAKSRGIILTPAQISESKMLKYVADRMKMYPLSGAASKATAQIGKWNESLAKTLGEKAKEVTPEVFAQAKARIGDTFETLTARNQLPVTGEVLDRLVAVQRDAADYADEATGKAVSNLIKRVMDQAKEGVLPGRTYQSIDSEIGQIAKAGGEKGMYLGRVRDALRSAMDDAISPADKAAWKEARQQWRALKTVEPLVAKSGGGALSPAALMGRVTANNAGKSSMASGTAGELGELARIGQKIKSPPSSGTSERQLADSLFNPLNWPALAARTALGGTVGRIPNSTALSRLLMSSAPANTLTALSRLAPSTGIAAGQLAAPVVAKERKRFKD